MLSVSLRADVIEELDYAAEYRPGAAQSAVLLGLSPAPGQIEVRAFADLAEVASPVVFARDLLAGWTPAERRAARLTPPLLIVGWVSLRRGAPGPPTPAETFVHRTFFNLPAQVTVCRDAAGSYAAYALQEGGELIAVQLVLPSPSTTGATQ